MKREFCPETWRPGKGGFLGGLRDVCSVASLACDRRGLVEEDVLPIYLLLELVAVSAGNSLMAALEGERGLFVIEERRLPFVAVVAGGTVAFLFGKLLAVRIFVALAACLRSLAEVDVQHGAFHVRRLVAIRALHGAVRADEGELRGGVIEGVQILPLLGCVACFAAERIALGILLRHALGKLAVMDVLVAGLAVKLREMIERLGIG